MELHEDICLNHDVLSLLGALSPSKIHHYTPARRGNEWKQDEMVLYKIVL